MAIQRVLLGVAGVAFLLAGCGESERGGGDGDGTIPPSVPVEADAFSRAYADAFCTSIGPCCAAQSYAFDANLCRSTLEALLTALVRYYAGQPNVSFDEQGAGRCVSAVRAAYTACTDRDAYAAVDDSCDMFRGTVPAGGSCHEGFECAETASESAYCDTGVCTVEVDPSDPFDAPHAAAGAACNYTCDDSGSCSGTGGDTVTGVCWTEDGLVCGSAGTCVSAPAVGSPCASYHCAVDAHCEGSVCVADTATGSCDSGDDACLSTSFCDYSVSPYVCRPRKQNGELCETGDECASDKCEGDRCVPWSVASPELCAGVLD
jgi:hypothetical protein